MSQKIYFQGLDHQNAQFLQQGLEREGFIVEKVSEVHSMLKTTLQDQHQSIWVCNFKGWTEDEISALSKNLWDHNSHHVVCAFDETTTPPKSLSGLRIQQFIDLQSPIEQQIKNIKSLATATAQLNTSKTSLEKVYDQMQRLQKDIYGTYLSSVDYGSMISSVKKDLGKDPNAMRNITVEGTAGSARGAVAYLIHKTLMKPNQPWVSLNCRSVSFENLEKEIFGSQIESKRGVLELADQGTLFLDDVSCLDARLQAKLLKFMQERKFRRVDGLQDYAVKVHMIFGLSENIDNQTDVGSFRKDLYQAMTAEKITIPQIQNLPEEVSKTVQRFAENTFQSCGVKFSGMTDELMSTLQHYPWPGNELELVSLFSRAASVVKGQEKIDLKHFVLPGTAKAAPLRSMDGESAGETTGSVIPFPKQSLSQTSKSYTDVKKQWMKEFEKSYLHDVLTRHGGNVSAAARESKIDRSNFLRLLRKYQIQSKSYRNENDDTMDAESSAA